MKSQTIQLRITRKQAESIQRRGDLYGGRGRYEIEDLLARQIVKKAGKLFQDIGEHERQLSLAWKIQNDARGHEEESGVSEIRLKFEQRLNEANAKRAEVLKALGEIENEEREEIEALFNQKFDEAGITLFRSGYPHGLRKYVKECQNESS